MTINATKTTKNPRRRDVKPHLSKEGRDWMKNQNSKPNYAEITAKQIEANEHILFIYGSKTQKKRITFDDFSRIRKELRNAQIQRITQGIIQPEDVQTISSTYDSTEKRGLIICANATSLDWYRMEMKRIHWTENEEKKTFKAWKKNEEPKLQPMRLYLPSEHTDLETGTLFKLISMFNHEIFGNKDDQDEEGEFEDEEDLVKDEERRIEVLSNGGQAIYFNMSIKQTKILQKKKWKLDFPTGQLDCNPKKEKIELRKKQEPSPHETTCDGCQNIISRYYNIRKYRWCEKCQTPRPWHHGCKQEGQEDYFQCKHNKELPDIEIKYGQRKVWSACIKCNKYHDYPAETCFYCKPCDERTSIFHCCSDQSQKELYCDGCHEVKSKYHECIRYRPFRPSQLPKGTFSYEQDQYI